MRYQGAAATANRLMGRFGNEAVFTRVTDSAFNPVTQSATPVTLTFRMNCTASPPGRTAEQRVGSLVNRNVIELHLAPRGGSVPQPGDKVQWAGFDWTVIWASALDPAGDGAPYTLAYAER